MVKQFFNDKIVQSGADSFEHLKGNFNKASNRSVSILVPTYNEAENIPLLIKSISETLSKINILYEIIIVDDNSSDNTAKIAMELNGKYRTVRVFIREYDPGYAPSYLLGLKEAKNDIVISMDADGSHPSDLLPLFIKEIEESDVVIASRWIKGGRTESSFKRVLLSKFTSAFFTIFFRLKVKDITSGYRAYKRYVVDDINQRSFKSHGFELLTEILVKLNNRYIIKEIPLEYVLRDKGESKMRTLNLLKRYIILILSILRG